MEPISEVEDLSNRWTRARKAAASALVGSTKDDAPEIDVWACASDVDQIELHRRLFENSAKLGDGFVRHFRRRIVLDDVPEILGSLGSPCMSGGTWTKIADDDAFRFERPPCQQGCLASTCDGWRESVDGLVIGLTGVLRHARIASAGHGQSKCVDIVYSNPESALRFGDLPDEIIPTLESIQRFVRLFKGTDVRFLGISEGVLLYQLDTSGCGDLRGNARELIEDNLRKKLPQYQVRELSPRPVLENGEGAEAPEHIHHETHGGSAP